MVSYKVIDEWYKEKTDTNKKETERMMIAAAKLLKEEIRAIIFYQLMNSEKLQIFFNTSSCVFLDTPDKGEIKCVKMEQEITRATRLHSVIAPLLFVLA